MTKNSSVAEVTFKRKNENRSLQETKQISNDDGKNFQKACLNNFSNLVMDMVNLFINYKICCFKIYPPIKLKQLSMIFILNPINNSFDHAEIEFI